MRACAWITCEANDASRSPPQPPPFWPIGYDEGVWGGDMRQTGETTRPPRRINDSFPGRTTSTAWISLALTSPQANMCRLLMWVPCYLRASSSFPNRRHCGPPAHSLTYLLHPRYHFEWDYVPSCRTPNLVCLNPPPATPHVPHLTPHTSHTSHLSHLTPHTSRPPLPPAGAIVAEISCWQHGCSCCRGVFGSRAMQAACDSAARNRNCRPRSPDTIVCPAQSILQQ